MTCTYLITKLVAGEAKNSKPRGLGILSMEFLQLLIILGCHASLRGNIDDKTYMASENRNENKGNHSTSAIQWWCGSTNRT